MSPFFTLKDKLKFVTVFGAGLLVGTALAVIIPEGINAMYTSGGKLKNSLQLYEYFKIKYIEI